MKKFDLHSHSIYSADSITPVEKLIDRYVSLGFAGFALTDHGTMAGVKKAHEYIRKKKLSLQLVAGCEFKPSVGEIIGLFLNEMIHTQDAGELVDRIHAQGGMAVLPHPFDLIRRSACPPSRLPKDVLARLDCIEIFNSRCAGMGPNRKAMEFVQSHPLPHTRAKSGAFSFAMTGGSDTHFLFEAGNGYTMVPQKLSVDKALRMRQTSAGGELSPIYVHGPTTLVKFAKKAGLLPRM